MKTVLWVSSFFPPQEDPASFRSLKLTKYLPRYGWKAIIVCPFVELGGYDNDLKKKWLQNEIPSENEIFFAELDPYESLLKKSKGGLFPWHHLLTIVGVPDRKFLWCFKASRIIKQILNKRKVDIVFTTCAPFSLNYLGIWLKTTRQIPWVTDFRDLWTLNPYMKNEFLHNRIFSKYMEAMTMKKCDRLVVNTPLSLKRMVTKYKDIGTKATVIPNGYDHKDIESICKAKVSVNCKSILFGGDMYLKKKLEYNPKFLLDVLKCCTDKNMLNPSWEIHYAGSRSELFKKLVEEANLKLKIVTHGYLLPKDYLNLLAQMGLVMLSIPHKYDTRSWIPARVYDYIGMRKKIFCVANRDSEVGKFLNEYGRSLVCYYSDNMDNIVDKFWEFSLKKENEIGLSESFIHKFSREIQAGSLAELFDRITK